MDRRYKVVRCIPKRTKLMGSEAIEYITLYE